LVQFTQLVHEKCLISAINSHTCTGNLDKVQVNNICSLVLLHSNFVGAYLGDWLVGKPSAKSWAGRQ
jgi:hypothetical protein